MALIDDFISQVTDPALRAALALEVAELKKHVTWGLVFERHRPESTRLLIAPIKVGSVVWERRAIKPRRLKVRGIEADQLIVALEPKNTTAPADAPTFQIARADVLVEKPFTEAIYPALTSLGGVRNGPADRPSHVVVEGENYHAIEALLPAYQKQVDVLYLDPPYNTGDKDWAYNNDYVDPKDAWRSSMWLAFMERRLVLGRRLLKDDGVMVVTIDENEVHHLGMLLEQTFKDARIQMVSIVINPIGQKRVGGLARVDEQAFFVFFGDAPAPVAHGDDLLNERPETKRAQSVRWEWLLRGGPSSGRAGHPGTFYPVLVDPDKRMVVRAGEPLADADPDLDASIDGLAAAWPMRADGSQGRWRIGPAKLNRLIEQGYVRLGGYDKARRTWTVLYVADSTAELIEKGTITVTGRDKNGVVSLDYAEERKFSPKTIWNRARHTAGIHGSHLLATFIGERGAFTFPKSLYAVQDTLDILVHDKPDALIVDFFAGSGTTLHATLLLNARDDGRRRCVLVTNNELNHNTAAHLHRQGKFRGDPEFEAAGVFEAATRPRVTAAITGLRPDGQPVQGTYLDEREYSEGFPENVEFFTLDYLDPIAIELGLHFRELHPLLWLTAGGIGEREDIDPASRFAVPAGSPYAVLFNPSGMPGLLAALEGRADVTHVFIVADSEGSFADLASALPAHVAPVQLYRNYLETLRAARA